MEREECYGCTAACSGALDSTVDHRYRWFFCLCKRWQVILKTKESNIKTKQTRGCQIEVTFFFFVFPCVPSHCCAVPAFIHRSPSWYLMGAFLALWSGVFMLLLSQTCKCLQFCFISRVTTVCIDEWCALRGEEAGARWHGLLCCPARQERPPLCCFAGGFVAFSC